MDNKSILVTGSSGFIGSHLVPMLKDKGAIVYELDRAKGRELQDTNIYPSVDIVIHLAAYNSTKDFYSQGFEVIMDNIIPTLNILSYYRSFTSKPLFVYTGTPESIAGATDYFNYKIPTDEDCPIVIPDIKNIRWSYAGSKTLGEQAVIASGLDYIIVRPNNVYGPRQRNHFVDEFIGRMKKGDTSLYGWKNTRSWIYVEDFCEAFIKVIENKLSLSEIINIGSNDETEVIKLAEIIAKNMNIDPSTIIKKDAPEGSVNRRMPDITKVKKLTGWEPTTTLEDGLAKTVKFYMEEE